MAKFSAAGRNVATVLAAASVLLMLKSLYSSQRSNDEQAPPERTVEITYNFTVADVPADAARIRIWVPVPLSNDHQQLHDVNFSNPWPCRMVQEPEFGNRFLIFDVNGPSVAASHEAVFSVKFCVTRLAVRPDESLHPVAADKLSRYLAPDNLIPIDGKIAEEAQQVAGHLQNPRTQARLLYDHILDTVRYDKSGTGWGRGDALYACNVRRGNCTDFHSLFIGQARALGIPARFIMGLLLPEDQTEGVISGYHCWGEFYLPQTGWCPVDVAQASKFPQKKEQCFCELDQHRVAFTVGRDIKLPESAAGPLNYVIYPHVEIDGWPYDNVRTSFSFKDCLDNIGKQLKTSARRHLKNPQIELPTIFSGFSYMKLGNSPISGWPVIG